MFIPSFTIASVRTRAACALGLVACLAQSLALAESAGGAQPLSLKEATALAVQRSALLTAGDARIKAAIEEVGRADQLPDPMLTFGVESVPISGSDAFSLSNDEMTMRSIGMSQAFPSRAKRNARRDSALALQAQADTDRAVSAVEIRRASANAWVALWAAQREHALLLELRSQADLVAITAKARVRGGSASVSDALAARAAELELDNRIDDARAAIAQARAGLARWISDDARREAGKQPDFTQLPVAADELLARLDQHAALRSWDSREAVAVASLGEARAERRPDWSIAAGVSRRNVGAANVFWLEVGIGLPIFQAGRQQRGVHARQADLQALHAAWEDARLAQLESVRGLIARWAAQSRKVDRFVETILPLGRDRSAAALAAWSAGEDLQAWIDARADEIRLRIEYARLLGEWGQSWAGLAFLLLEEVQP
jgi:cobalt-zinc-cadmium efflux system outer membrane protein